MPLIFLPLVRFAVGLLTVTFPKGQKTFSILAHLFDAVCLTFLSLQLVDGTPVTLSVGGAPIGIGINFFGDRIGLTFAALAWALSVAVNLYIWRAHLRRYFHMLLHLLIGACYALVFTKDLFNAYLLIELTTLVSFLLVGYERRPRQIWASLRYLILSSFGMSIFLLGVAVVYAHCGCLDLDLLRVNVQNAAGQPWTVLAGALLVAGIAVKAGVFTFSLWLPSAHARAMPAVSAMLSGLVIKMGVVELFRLADVFPLQLPLIVLGSFTSLLGILYALQTYDVKKLLAFSTLSQIGYILIGFGAGSTVARLGALSYAVAHGLFKSLLFLTVGEAAARVGSSDFSVLVEHRRKIPWPVRAALWVAVLGIIGLPPLAGFDAKAVLEDGLHSFALRFIIFLISIGTVTAFARFFPLLWSRSDGQTCPWRTAAYTWLGLGILLFLPLEILLSSFRISMHAFSLAHMVEAGLAIGLGSGLYLAIRKRSFTLPQRIFQLEESPLIILLGFFVVYALLAWPR